MIGRMIERLFIQVRADMTHLSTDIQRAVGVTGKGTKAMSAQWKVVSISIERMSNDLKRGIITQGQYMAQMNKHASAVAKLGGTYQQAQKKVFAFAKQVNVASNVMAGANRRAFNTRPIQQFSRSTGQARMQMLNLGYQINDVGMTLATGMNPLTVMIQQGSQILQIYAGQGGIRMALKDISRILGGIGKKLWPLAMIAAGFGLITREINKSSDTAVSFMDTTKAVFQVMGRSISKSLAPAFKWMNEEWEASLNGLADILPRMANAAIASMVVIVKGTKILWEQLPDIISDQLVAIKNKMLDHAEAVGNLFLVTIPQYALDGANKLVQSFVFGFRAIKVVWEGLPDVLKDAIGGAVNYVVGGIEKMTQGVIEGFKDIFRFLDKLPKAVKDAMGIGSFLNSDTKVDLSKWKMDVGNATRDVMAAVGVESARTFNENFIKGISVGEGINLQDKKGTLKGGAQQFGNEIRAVIDQAFDQDYMGEFFAAVKDQAVTNALARIASGVEDVGGAAASAAEEVNEMMKKLNEGLTTAADNLAGVFGDAFERFAETGKLSIGSVIKDLNKLIITASSSALQQGLSGMFQSFATSSGGLGSPLAGLFTGLFGGGMGMTLPARAGGGVEMPWRSFVAGERGSELITQDGPAGARRVSTAGRTKQLMSGGQSGNVNVTINVSTPDAESFKKSQGQIAGRMSGFLNKGRRNG